MKTTAGTGSERWHPGGKPELTKRSHSTRTLYAVRPPLSQTTARLALAKLFGTTLQHPHTPGKHAAAAANPCTHSYGGCYNPACSARPLPPNSRQPASGDRFQCFTLRQQHQLQVQGQGKHSGCPAHEVDRSRRLDKTEPWPHIHSINRRVSGEASHTYTWKGAGLPIRRSP